MYLYLYHNDKLNIKQQSKKELKSASEFSEKMVRKALLDFSERMQLDLKKENLVTVEILRDNKGKPYFHDLQIPVHFSISHSGEWWGCLMAMETVGFDLEASREKVKFDKIALRFFAEGEYEYILAGGLEAFLRVWVRKEAYVKYLGTGLGEGLSSFSVVDNLEFSTQIMKINENGNQRIPCFVREFEMQSGVKAAYCSGSGAPIKEMITLK